MRAAAILVLLWCRGLTFLYRGFQLPGHRPMTEYCGRKNYEENVVTRVEFTWTTFASAKYFRLLQLPSGARLPVVAHALRSMDG